MGTAVAEVRLCIGELEICDAVVLSGSYPPRR